MGIRLNKNPEGSSNVFHDNFNQLIDLAKQKDPNYKAESLSKDLEDLNKQKTSIIYQGRFMRFLNKFLKRKPKIPSHEIAKNLANYSFINSESKKNPKPHLETTEKEKALKWVKKLQNWEIEKHPRSKKSIEKQFQKYIELLKSLPAKDPALAIFPKNYLPPK